MASVAKIESERKSLTVADLNRRFGAIPIERIRMQPAPGSATEDDFLAAIEHRSGLCELVDGILVEKTVGWQEALLATWLATLLSNFVRPNRLGKVLGPDGPIRFGPGLIRVPDVSYISRERLHAANAGASAILPVAPNLAVEVLSPSNTAKEMQRKLQDYFQEGVELVWLVDLRQRTVEVFTAVGKSEVLRDGELLTGGVVLPGFQVSLSDLFSELDE